LVKFFVLYILVKILSCNIFTHFNLLLKKMKNFPETQSNSQKVLAIHRKWINVKSTPVETHVVNAIDDIKRSGLALD